MRRYTLAALLAAGLALFALASLSGGGTAHACSCALPPGSPAEELAKADAVFAGVATSVKAHRKLFILPSSADPVTVEFEVSHVWKGPQQETLTVSTVRSESSCGYEFQEGEWYIVYARNGETGLCSRTMPTWRAFADFKELDAPWEPERIRVITVGPDRGGGCTSFAATSGNGPELGALALLAGAVLLGVRRGQ